MVLSCLALVSLINHAYSWSSIGHDAIGSIALTQLDQNGINFVMHILGAPAISDIWPAIKDAGRWPDMVGDNMSWSRELHFISITDYKYTRLDLDRDCGKCIVSAIAHYTMKALDPRANKGAKAEALGFLIHFMGDIHQPLHVGYKPDVGGNFIPIEGYTNLHNVWDYDLIRDLDLRSLPNKSQTLEPTPTDTFLRSLCAADVRYSTILDMALRIAHESNQLARKASYRHSECPPKETCYILADDTLEPKYWEDNSEVAERQLKRAGTRLATLLNLMVDAFQPNSPTLGPGAASSRSRQCGHAGSYRSSIPVRQTRGNKLLQ